MAGLTTDPYSDNIAEESKLIVHTLRGEGFDASEDGTGRGTPLVPVYAIQEGAVRENVNIGPQGKGFQPDIAYTLVASHHVQAAAYQCHGANVGPMGTLRSGNGNETGGVPFMVMAHGQGGAEVVAGQSPTLTCDHEAPILFSCKDYGADAGPISPTLRAMGHDASHANAGGQVAVALKRAVRRLTPRECERLQGFPTCIERLIINVCFDHQNKSADAVLRSRKLHSDALLADERERTGLAPSADVNLWRDLESREALAGVHVRMSYEPKVVAISNRKRLHWCASGAESQNWYHPSTQTVDFALGIVALAPALEALITDGRAGSPPNIRRFTLPVNGSWPAVTFGPDSVDNANDAIRKLVAATKSITSSRGPNSKLSDSTAQTLLCSVLGAMTLCIPNRTFDASSFSAVIDIERDYTLVTHRKKPAADGPRYKAIGNSIAIPVLRWIGQRILASESNTDKKP